MSDGRQPSTHFSTCTIFDSRPLAEWIVESVSCIVVEMRPPDSSLRAQAGRVSARSGSVSQSDTWRQCGAVVRGRPCAQRRVVVEALQMRRRTRPRQRIRCLLAIRCRRPQMLTTTLWQKPERLRAARGGTSSAATWRAVSALPRKRVELARRRAGPTPEPGATRESPRARAPRIFDQASIDKNILDMRGVEEFEAAEFHEGNIAVA